MKKKTLTVAILLIVLISLTSFLTFPVQAVKVIIDDNIRDREVGITTDGSWYDIYLDPEEPGARGRLRHKSKIWDQELGKLKKEFPNWEFRVSANPAPGEFRVKAYDAVNDKTCRGPFRVHYVENAPDFPPPGAQLQWIQFVYGDGPKIISNGQDSPPYIDPTWWPPPNYPNRNFEDGFPFYWNETLREIYTITIGNQTTFIFTDQPSATLTVESYCFRAHLYLVTESKTVAGKTVVTFYDTIVWGFKFKRVWETYPGNDEWGGCGKSMFAKFDNLTLPFVAGFDAVNVIDMSVSSTSLTVGSPLYINVVVKNHGDLNKSFNLRLYADQEVVVLGNETIIATEYVPNLSPNSSITLNFTWETTGITTGNYWISAEAHETSGQIDRLIYDIWIEPSLVGGVWVPVDKFVLLAPYIALASTIIVATAVAAVYVKHRKKH